MKKYRLFRNPAEDAPPDARAELIGVEFGENIEDATPDLMRAINEDLVGMPGYEKCETSAFPPEKLHVTAPVRVADYEMIGTISPVSAAENILIEYGVFEDDA